MTRVRVPPTVLCLPFRLIISTSDSCNKFLEEASLAFNCLTILPPCALSGVRFSLKLPNPFHPGRSNRSHIAAKACILSHSTSTLLDKGPIPQAPRELRLSTRDTRIALCPASMANSTPFDAHNPCKMRSPYRQKILQNPHFTVEIVAETWATCMPFAPLKFRL